MPMTIQTASENTCFHCGLPIPSGQNQTLDVFKQKRHFCCSGCLFAAKSILESGLSQYYRERTSDSPTVSNIEALSKAECSFFNNDENQDAFTHLNQNHHRQTVLAISGMQCAACSWLINNGLQKIEGVTGIHVNPGTQQARLTWEPDKVKLSHILNQLNKLGYQALPIWNRDINDEQSRTYKASLKRLGISGLGMMQVMMFSVALYAGAFTGIESLYENLLRWVSMLVSSGVLLYAGSPFIISAIKGLKLRKLNMDAPISLALTGAYFSSIWATLSHSGEVYFDSVTMFIFFLTLGRFLEEGGRYRANITAQTLLKCMPKTAMLILEDGEEKLVSVSDLNPSDQIRIKPGATIPVDATVIEGKSSVDESLLTGEIKQKTKTIGSSVSGGSQNIESTLILRVTQHVQHSLISNIVLLMERGLEQKPAIAILADNVAQYFVLALLIISVFVFTGWWFLDSDRALWVTLSVLVITCPCALSLATPVALTASSNALMKKGILLTRSNVLEKILKADTVIFDKTGTLTLGKFILTEIYSLSDYDKTQCLAIAMCLEKHSEHPIGSAFRNCNSDTFQFTAENIINHPNQGIEGRIDGTLYRIGKVEFANQLDSETPLPPTKGESISKQHILLCSEREAIAWFEMEDPLRQEVPSVLKEIKSAGIPSSVMLSGDPSASAQVLAAPLGFDVIHTDYSPKQKLQHVNALQKSGHRVIMVGDGINDAPVLAQADVSFALSNGSELAKTSADVVLLNDNLRLVLTTREAAKKTLNIIRQNMVWAISYNGIALPLAIMGLIEPYMAVIGMSASSLIVVLNSLRLHR